MPDPPSRETVLGILADRLPDSTLREIFPESDPSRLRRLIRGRPDQPGSDIKAPASCAPNHNPHSCQLFTDGASRGNPGEAGAGIVLLNDQGLELATRSVYLGQCTNNVAEYQALLQGLQLALELGCPSLQIFLDSELIVRQLQGQYKVKHPGLRPLFAQAKKLLDRFERWQIQHVPRSRNSRADALANRAIDQNRS